MSERPLIKPEQLDGLPGISEDNKRVWKSGLSKLWLEHNNYPEGSPGRNDAKNKLATASSKIMQTISNRSKQANPAGGGQRAPQSAQGGGQGGQPQAAQQGGQGQQGGQTAQNPQQSQVQQPQQTQAIQQPQQNQQNQQNQQAQQAQQQQLQAMQARVRTQVNKMQVFPAPNIANNQEFMAWKESFSQRYGNALLRTERAQFEFNRVTNTIKQVQAQNGEVTEEMKRKYTQVKEALQSGKEESRSIEEENDRNKTEYNRKSNKNQDQQQTGQAAGNSHPNGGQAPDTSRPSTQQGQNQGDVKMQHSVSNSPQQSQGQFPQQLQQTQGASTPVQHSTPQQVQQRHPQPPAQPQNQATPHSATQPQMPQQQNPNFPQNNMGQQMPHQQQQQQPQMNQQQPSQQPQYPQQQQYPNAAQSNLPQSNMPNVQNQRPQPLTQQAAMAQAAQTYTQNNQQPVSATQPQQQMQQPHANMPNGLPFNNAPHSATQQHTPTGRTGFPTDGQISSSQTKFAIPKELKLDPRTQQPVQGPPARPTFQTGNMMNTPGITKPPPFTLEGEGDHVLSKRKLDELVRQITGSTSPSDNLSPEVEEAVLGLTDNFVDNVVQKACQLAKLRQGQTLDVRDVQMVLERNYGIRIPGYSLDEVRTVRKFQPAPGWVGKVQAVQAGKVMGGGKDS